MSYQLPDNPSRKRGRRAFSAAVVIAIVICLLLIWQGRRQARLASDAAMATEVEQYVITTLSSKGPDDPLIRRLGAFKKLNGAGFSRVGPVFDIPPYVFLGRTAVFDRGKVRVNITIGKTGPLDMTLSISPDGKFLAANPLFKEITLDAAWLAAHPEVARFAAQGDVLVIQPDNAGTSPTSIEMWVTHPSFKPFP